MKNSKYEDKRIKKLSEYILNYLVGNSDVNSLILDYNTFEYLRVNFESELEIIKDTSKYKFLGLTIIPICIDTKFCLVCKKENFNYEI